MRAVAASDGAIVGRAQARFAPLGSGPLVAELMNAPLFAQLRYSGPADTLWRLTGSEVIDMSGPLAVGADIGGRLAEPGHPRLAQDPERAARKPGHRHGHRQARRRSALLRAAADLQPDQRPNYRRRIDQRQRLGHLLRRQRAPRPRLQREPGAAAQPRRRRRAGDRSAKTPAPTQTAGLSRATSSSTKAASSSAGRAPRPPCRSSTCARPASTKRTSSNRPRSITGTST